MKIGIIGGGQLALMLGESINKNSNNIKEFKDVDLEYIGCIDDCASKVMNCKEIKLEDEKKIVNWAKKKEIVTIENENIDIELLAKISKVTELYPPVEAIQVSQDRLLEKQMFTKLGIECPKFYKVDDLSDLKDALEICKVPGILKTRRFGYDGKGQHRVNSEEDIEVGFEKLKDSDGGLIYEAFVDFDYEVSKIASFNNKNSLFFPLAKNEHSKGVLIKTTVKASENPLEKEASRIIKLIAKHINYSGTLTVEFFVKDGKLIANEIAPRVHNSGHWSIEAANISQFDAHLIGIMNEKFSKLIIKDAVMFNLLGDVPIIKEDILEKNINNIFFHNYGKEKRKGRKLGHITIIKNNLNDLNYKNILKYIKSEVSLKLDF